MTPGHRGCIGRTAVFRRCGRRPPPKHRYGWRSSYNSPDRGHSHDRYIWGEGQHGRVLPLAVVTFLPLFWLSTGVVVFPAALVTGGSRLRGRSCTLDFSYLRFNLIHEANVLVVLHDLALGHVITARDGAGTQIDVAQIGHFHASNVQSHGHRKEGHAKGHCEARLANHAEERVEYRGCPGANSVD